MAEMYLEITELFFIVGAFMGLALGLLLWLQPEWVRRMSTAGNKWYSGRKPTKALDIMRDTDSFYFRNNLVFGTIMFVISILALYLVIVRMPSAEQVVAIMGDSADALGLGLILDAFRWVLIVVIFLGLPVWGFLVLAPARLQSFNGMLNRWISTRLLLLPLERMNTTFDSYVLHHNRIFGSIMILGSGFILFKFLV